MNSVISLLSLLGTVQAAILAIIFFANRQVNRYNRWLSLLFLMLGLTLISISLPNRNIVSAGHLFELVEFCLTFVVGPFLYLLTLRFLDKPIPSRKVILFHFTPFLLYILFQLVLAVSSKVVHIPILLPLIYLQFYTLWLTGVVFLHRQKINMQNEAYRWLVMIAGLLICIHIAQWIRYFYSDLPMFKQLVPAIGFASVYGITLYGFKSSWLLNFKHRSNPANLSPPEMDKYSGKLCKIMEQEKIYIDPRLTIDDLAEHMDIPSYQLSQLINNAFGKGFNDFINIYRVEEVKRLLKDSSFNHLTIEALAKEAGFNSRSSFYSAFKKRTGTTPSSYKRQTYLSVFINSDK